MGLLETSDWVRGSGAQLGVQDALLNARHRDTVLRNLLLGGVAAGIAMFSYGRTTYAACATDDTTVTCTGDLSDGVATTNPIAVLNVNSLTTDIAPAVNDGIHFTSDGSITIISDTGDFEVIASGVGAKGIYAHASGAGAVSVTHTGDITSDSGRGISAFSSSGPVTTDSSGSIQGDLEGIYARTTGAGAVSVTHTGDITSISNQGIYASSDSGMVTTVTSGDIQSNDRGIFAKATGAGDVSVTHTGDITSDNNRGIYVLSSSGAVTTVSQGTIQAADAGIYAKTIGAGVVSVTHTGDITSTFNRGIYASADSGAVTTVSQGTIQAADAGIYAKTIGAGAVSVTHTGDITSTLNRGIYARSDSGAVTTVSQGTIQAADAGISAYTGGVAAVSVTHTGDITSDNNLGIYARSNLGAVTTVSSGDIQAVGAGISASTSGTAAVSVTHTGDITSTLNRGIDARSNSGAVTTVSRGDIQAVDIGISADTDGAATVSVTHTGDITSTDNRGIDARSNDGAVFTVSSGTVQAENDGVYARSTGAGAVSVIHTGDITSDVNRGIFAESVNGSVAITLGEGVVEGANGAIEASSGTGTALTLNAGSVLIGSVTIGGAGASVLNTGTGLSIAHTFTGTVPTIGNVSGNVAVVSGNQIAVADVSGLAAADDQLSDILDGVSGVLATSPHRANGNWWISSFGGMGVTDADSNSIETSQKYGGLIAGTFALLDNGVELGIFAGAARGAYTTEVTNGLSGSTTSYFAGLNSRFTADLFSIDFSVTAGVSSNEVERIIANNTVATGLETALSSYDSFFIAPEITLTGAPLTIHELSFIPSLRIRYEGMMSGDFTETGVTTGGIMANGATSHVANIRLQGAIPIDLNVRDTTLTVRGGVDTRFARFSGHDVKLLGIVTNNAGAEDEFSARGFAGMDFTHEFAEQASLTASGEVRAGTTGLSASASLGFKSKF